MKALARLQETHQRRGDVFTLSVIGRLLDSLAGLPLPAGARHDAGAALSDEELRDELMPMSTA
jgi:hypothetical protein